MTPPPMLTDAQRALLGAARRAVLVTIRPDGTPRPVPVCFALAELDDSGGVVLHTPIDDKPKASTDPFRLARVRDIVARPAVSVLVDRWDEDWTQLGWLRLDGRARLLLVDAADDAVERRNAIGALRGRYAQYATHDLESRPIIRIDVERIIGWGSGA
jgi:PPOX class probable F420-dependent enzyme